MKIQTVSVIVPVAQSEVFAFLAAIENLPAWATEFCERVEHRAGRWIVHTAQGELFFEIEADARTGVIDLRGGPTPEALALFPVRVLALPSGVTAITFTFFQRPGMSEETFAQQCRSLLIEMRGLAERFGGGEVHAADAA
ncbi:MAG: hypothetical protein ABIZ49_04745 [Opitutaceae bacterium]